MKPSGARFPLTVCCPTEAIIWQMLREEPFEPQTDMTRGELCQGSSAIHILPADSRTLERSPLSSLSSDSSRLHPGFSSSVPAW